MPSRRGGPGGPSPSTTAPAETPGTGLTNTDPAFWPPGWCSRRQRTISAMLRLGLDRGRPPRARSAPTTTTWWSARSEPRNAQRRARGGHLPILAAQQVEHVDPHRGSAAMSRAVSAGVHPHGAADRSGDTDGPLEPGEPGRGASGGPGPAGSPPPPATTAVSRRRRSWRDHEPSADGDTGEALVGDEQVRAPSDDKHRQPADATRARRRRARSSTDSRVHESAAGPPTR